MSIDSSSVWPSGCSCSRDRHHEIPGGQKKHLASAATEVGRLCGSKVFCSSVAERGLRDRCELRGSSTCNRHTPPCSRKFPQCLALRKIVVWFWQATARVDLPITPRMRQTLPMRQFVGLGTRSASSIAKLSVSWPQRVSPICVHRAEDTEHEVSRARVCTTMFAQLHFVVTA